MTLAWERAGSRLPVFTVAVALMAIGASWGASSARAAGGVGISVGYADSDRASPTLFPDPWVGSPGVIFEGCTRATSPTGKCIFDSSAVRLVNQGSSRVVVNKVVVRFPGAAAGGADCTFDIWQHNISLPAGREVIFAQTAPRARAGCNPAGGYIDGSEMGPNGVDWGGGTHCTNSGIIPRVAVTIDNSRQTFTDTGQVLNTTGQDAESCPKPINGRRNESEPWTPTTCISPASLVLNPPTQRHFVGDTATIAARFENGCEEPIQGVTESFHDLTGPDATLTGRRLSDANGRASLSYTSLATGTDTWDVTVTSPARRIISNTVKVIWIKPPCPSTTRLISITAPMDAPDRRAPPGEITCGSSLSIGPSTMKGDLKGLAQGHVEGGQVWCRAGSGAPTAAQHRACVSGPGVPGTSYCGDPGFGPRGATFSAARATAVANARLGARCNGPFTVAVT